MMARNVENGKKMGVILLHDHYDDAHLAAVIEEMRSLGAPTIRAIWDEAYGNWVALEGCHRIRAAKALGLIPKIEEVEYDEDKTLADMLDIDSGLGERDYGIAAIVDEAYGRPVIWFCEQD